MTILTILYGLIYGLLLAIGDQVSSSLVAQFKKDNMRAYTFALLVALPVAILGYWNVKVLYCALPVAVVLSTLLTVQTRFDKNCTVRGDKIN